MTYLSSCPLFGFGSCVGAKKICSAATGCNCLQLVQILPKETDVEQAMRFSFVCCTSFSEHGVFVFHSSPNPPATIQLQVCKGSKLSFPLIGSSVVVYLGCGH